MSAYCRTASDLAASTKLPPTARHIFLVLAIHANTDGLAWPTVETIGRHVGITPSNVRRGMRTLITAGLLEVVDQSPGRRSNTYRLAVPDAVRLIPNPRGSARVEISPTRAVARVNPRGSARNPRGSARQKDHEEPKNPRAFLPGSGWLAG